jgi:DNA-binding NarL/FixJ family response regulator
MRKIVVSVQNGLLAESISRMLEESSEFLIYRSVVGGQNNLAVDCAMYEAEIVLMEVSLGRGLSLQSRLEETKQIRRTNSGCKIVLLCDENTAPDLAREVALSKKDGLVDGFFYSSVTGAYLVAALASL